MDGMKEQASSNLDLSALLNPAHPVKLGLFLFRHALYSSPANPL
jgi:hypothetical protein